jgi:3D (Asp-Asp-Asp) domain-containing protein
VSSKAPVADTVSAGKTHPKKRVRPISKSGATVSGQRSESVPAKKPAKKTARYDEVTLIATAYYSPLPNQNYYLRNSHQEEVTLNGKGTNGASGKPVFVGMIAAPKGYDFGTKIWVEGFGVGSVEDRGGAIVST